MCELYQLESDLYKTKKVKQLCNLFEARFNIGQIKNIWFLV